MLDEWQSFAPVAPPSLASFARPVDDDEEPYGAPTSNLSGNRIFSIDILEQNASKGHGFITSMAAGNNVVIVGTNKGWLVRHDYGIPDKLELDLSISRSQDQTVHRVFIDPGGRHCVATVRGSNGAETYYLHGKWKKPRILNKLKGMIIHAVAWNRQHISESSTGELILGTLEGQLYEALVEEKDKREKYIKLLYELNELKEPFIGLQMEMVGSGGSSRCYVLAATSSRLYIFSGTGSLEVVFASYADRAPRFTELPGDVPNSEIHFYGKQRRAESFAWLAGPGIYHGDLHWVQQSATNTEESVLANKWLLTYSSINEDGSNVKPCSLALSEYHLFLLYHDRLKVVNRVNQKVVEVELFDARLDLGTVNMLALCTDYAAGAYYAYDENSIFEISIRDEGRDMWQVYLDLKEYTAALEHCRDPLQKDKVYEAQAEAAFATKDFVRAASFYAKINHLISFEEIALKFISANELDALRMFLLTKLDNLGKDDRSQITMIATWLTELYLDKIFRLLLGGEKKFLNAKAETKPEGNEEYTIIVEEFRAFLSDCKDVLDQSTTLKLLGSYGRVEELMYFANLKELHEMVIKYYIEQRDAKRALVVLRKSNVLTELRYKFATQLMLLDANKTVDFWMTCSGLDPRRLIPALSDYSSEPRAKDEPHEAIRYLEFCVHDQHNEDTQIHNLLVSLYAKQKDEKALLRFLQCKCGRGRPGRPDYFYDPRYALMACLEEKQMRACVFIYSMMGMHTEAVDLALQVDPDLAKVEADKVEEDEELRKKLWLMVAKHVINQEKYSKEDNIRKAIAFLKETDGLLKIEDILPFFPDFTLIDDFKEEISKALEEYKSNIEELKLEMNEATQAADKIRKDISSLSQRYAIVSRDEECGVCGRQILAQGGARGTNRGYASSLLPFCVFACEHAFHAECLTDYVLKHADKNEKHRIMELRKRQPVIKNEVSSQLPSTNSAYDEGASADGSITPVDEARRQFDDAVVGECPFCGEMMIREIARPFISSEESDIISSWEIGSSKEFNLI